MTQALLIRIEVSDECVRGFLYCAGATFATLEPPWLDNRRGVSCIPAASYHCRYLERSASGKYRKVYHLLGVRGRSGILTHAGNTAAHTKGCILIGKSWGRLAGRRAILNSKSAMRDLVDLVGEDGMTLRIIGDQP